VGLEIWNMGCLIVQLMGGYGCRYGRGNILPYGERGVVAASTREFHEPSSRNEGQRVRFECGEGLKICQTGGLFQALMLMPITTVP